MCVVSVCVCVCCAGVPYHLSSEAIDNSVFFHQHIFETDDLLIKKSIRAMNTTPPPPSSPHTCNAHTCMPHNTHINTSIQITRCVCICTRVCVQIASLVTSPWILEYGGGACCTCIPSTFVRFYNLQRMALEFTLIKQMLKLENRSKYACTALG